jgi:hypothetical protein
MHVIHVVIGPAADSGFSPLHCLAKEPGAGRSVMRTARKYSSRRGRRRPLRAEEGSQFGHGAEVLSCRRPHELGWMGSPVRESMSHVKKCSLLQGAVWMKEVRQGRATCWVLIPVYGCPSFGPAQPRPPCLFAPPYQKRLPPQRSQGCCKHPVSVCARFVGSRDARHAFARLRPLGNTGPYKIIT